MFKISDANSLRRMLARLAPIAAPIALETSDVVRLFGRAGAAEGVEHRATFEARIGAGRVATVLDMFGMVLFVPAILWIVYLLCRSSVVLNKPFSGHNCREATA